MTATILVVDDSALARRTTRRTLEAGGYRVIEAEDGLSALEKYYVDRPDVVVLDLVMRGMYGLDVLSKLKEIDPHARVIVISADIQTTSRDLATAGGASGFLSKPAKPDEVLAAVEQALAMTR